MDHEHKLDLDPRRRYNFESLKNPEHSTVSAELPQTPFIGGGRVLSTATDSP